MLIIGSLVGVALIAMVVVYVKGDSWYAKRNDDEKEHAKLVESEQLKSVNYHFTRQCNYKCGFCFHTAKSSNHGSLDKAKQFIKLFKEHGMKKINFSGGEPFLIERGNHVGEMVKYAKEVGVESVSIVSNGSLITESWFEKYGEYLDILAVSVDSFDVDTLQKIGRWHKEDHTDIVFRIREWCDAYKVGFKMNTVVCQYNKDEDFHDVVRRLKPVRWKVFQCLEVEGENSGANSKRSVQPFLISDEEFSSFVSHHSDVSSLVPESNDTMRNSYIIVDENFSLLNNTTGAKVPTIPVLQDIIAAVKEAGFDQESFKERNGEYAWCKENLDLEW